MAQWVAEMSDGPIDLRWFPPEGLSETETKSFPSSTIRADWLDR